MSYGGWIAGFLLNFSSAAVDVDALTKLVFWNPDRGDKQNMTDNDNKRLDGRNKKKTVRTVLLYVYMSTPLQQYQYIPKETVRHQASCEEVYTYVYPVSLAATT